MRLAHEALAFDVGFYNGDDSALLLMHGYRVLAIEANPALVARGRVRFAEAIQRGQLTLLNQALARTEAEIGSVLPFYVNRHEWAWSSFHSNVGCRPRNSSQDCDARPVRAESCAALLAKYGVPLILKLDIEGIHYYVGYGDPGRAEDGEYNNCLIDSLRQEI